MVRECPKCGAVNWDSAAQCISCKSELDSLPPPPPDWKSKPDIKKEKRRTMSGRWFPIGVVLAVFAIILGGIGYMITPPQPLSIIFDHSFYGKYNEYFDGYSFNQELWDQNYKLGQELQALAFLLLMVGIIVALISAPQSVIDAMEEVSKKN